MTEENKHILACACVWAIGILLVFGGYLWIKKQDEEWDSKAAKRQEAINTFYVTHNCRPEGYVATRYEPMRTYCCDNGIFVASDMK